MSTVLVTGGRSYFNEVRVYQILDAAVERLGLSEIIHGDADGADGLAKQWAAERGVPQRKFPAAWDDLSHPDADIRTNRLGKKYDRRAGSRRNQQMLEPKGTPRSSSRSPAASALETWCAVRAPPVLSRSWSTGTARWPPESSPMSSALRSIRG